MDVDQPAGEALDEAVAEDAHVAGADHPVRPDGGHRIAQFEVEGGAVGKGFRVAAPAQRRGNAGQCGAAALVGEHAGDLRRQAAIGDGVEDRLQVAAAPGHQHGEAARRSRFPNRVLSQSAPASAPSSRWSWASA